MTNCDCNITCDLSGNGVAGPIPANRENWNMAIQKSKISEQSPALQLLRNLLTECQCECHKEKETQGDTVQ